MHYSGTTALVTGASSGIGAAFARRLASLGADVVLVGRRADALSDLAAEITSATGRTAIPVTLDLSGDGAATMLRERLGEQGVRVDTVINCAGIGVTKPFAESAVDEIRAQLDLDVLALVEVTHAFLPDMIASGRGALVNIGSLTGYMPVPDMAVYSAAKAFVIRFTEAIAYELRDTGLSVLVASPGPTHSRFYSRGGTSTEGVRFQTPEQVVTTSLRALDRRHPPVSVVSGRVNRLLRHVVTLLPRRIVLRTVQSTPNS